VAGLGGGGVGGVGGGGGGGGGGGHSRVRSPTAFSHCPLRSLKEPVVPFLMTYQSTRRAPMARE
jgi:hypothetical protein